MHLLAAAKAMLWLLLLSAGAADAQDLAGRYGSYGRAEPAVSAQGPARMARPLGAFNYPSAPQLGLPVLRLEGRQLRPNDYAMLSANAAAYGHGQDLAWAETSSKINLEFKLSKSSWGLEHGSLGLRLDTGYRLSLKTRRGGAMLYLRGQF